MSEQSSCQRVNTARASGSRNGTVLASCCFCCHGALTSGKVSGGFLERRHEESFDDSGEGFRSSFTASLELQFFSISWLPCESSLHKTELRRRDSSSALCPNWLSACP